jgi:hypothetical protein
MDRFLLSENPMAGNTLAIVHTQQPVSIILVDEGHITTKYPHEHHTYRNSDGIGEPVTLSLYHCYSMSFDGDENARKVNKLFRDAWHWYMAYLKWEDEQIDIQHGEED